MVAADWSAIAAWIGACLGAVNLVVNILSKRPVFFLMPPIQPQWTSWEKCAARLCVQAGENPVFIKWAKAFPHFEPMVLCDPDADEAGKIVFKGMLRWLTNRTFRKIVPAKSLGTISITDMPPGRTVFLIIRWTSFTCQPFPLTFVIITPRRRTQLRQVVDMDYDGEDERK